MIAIFPGFGADSPVTTAAIKARGPTIAVVHSADPLRVARHYLRTAGRFDLGELAAALAAQCPRPQGWADTDAQAQAQAAAKSLGPAHEKALRLALLDSR